MPLKNLLLLACLLLGPLAPFSTLNGYPTEPIVSSSSNTIPPDCSLPAPTNFQVFEVGPDWVALSWTPVGPQPDSYTIRIFRSSNNQLVATTSVPGWMTNTRVFNLPNNEQMYGRITPVCSDGNESPNSNDSPDFNTTIIDLIVTGFTPNIGGPQCTINTQNLSCEFSSAIDYYSTFKVTSKNQRVSYFKIARINEFGDYLLKVNNSAPYYHPDYTFQCLTGSNNQCPGMYILVFDQGAEIARIFVVASASGTAKLQAQSIASNYNIIKVGAGYSLQSDESDDRFGQQNPGNKQLRCAPNPFTDDLDVEFPATLAHETIILTLYDLQGRNVLSSTVPGGTQHTTLSTASLDAGMYFLRMTTAGKEVAIKVMKTR